jgi:malonate transporter MadL subunit
MTIYGVAILAGCYILGLLLGESLGSLLDINANVGGVGFAMFLLMFASDWMHKKGFIKPDAEAGIRFWSSMYIPVIVAMAAIQNVKLAVSSGWLAILAGILPTAIAFSMIPLLSGKIQKEKEV